MSSDDSMDDEIPIKYLAKRKQIAKHGQSSAIEKRITKQGHSAAMEALIKRKQLECEFCNVTCNNMYSILVHNASHIMVLLKHGIPRCKRCNMHFASQSQLEIHNKKQHYNVPNIFKDNVKSSVVKSDTSFTDLLLKGNNIQPVKDLTMADTICIKTGVNCINMGTKPVPQVIGKQPVIRCEDTVTNLSKAKNKQPVKELKTADTICIKTGVNSINIGTKLVAQVGKQPVIRCEDTLTRLINGDTIIDEQLPVVVTNLPLVTTKESLVVRCDDSVTKLLNGDCKPERLKHEREKEIECEAEMNTPSQSNTANIKSKIMFEDDMEEIDGDIIVCNVKEEIFDLTASDSDNDNQEFKSNKIVLGSKVNTGMDENKTSLIFKKDEPILQGNFAPSVHYEDLMQGGLFACKFCIKTFPNNYQKITHEVIHMKINPRPNTLYLKVRICRFCDQYIAGNHYNLKRHRLEEHLQLDVKEPFSIAKTCDKCHLRYYSYGRHFFKYHLIYTCPRCSKPYEKESALANHKTKCTGLKYDQEPKITELRTIQLCEVCSIFHLKSRRYNYRLVGEYSKEGERVRCQACNKECFEVKLLRYVSYRKNCEYQCKSKAPITNEVRLKNIQQRLKHLNLLSKR